MWENRWTVSVTNKLTTEGSRFTCMKALAIIMTDVSRQVAKKLLPVILFSWKFLVASYTCVGKSHSDEATVTVVELTNVVVTKSEYYIAKRF